MLIMERGYRGMDTASKSVTFVAEIGTWLDSNRLDLQGHQGKILPDDIIIGWTHI